MVSILVGGKYYYITTTMKVGTGGVLLKYQCYTGNCEQSIEIWIYSESK